MRVVLEGLYSATNLVAHVTKFSQWCDQKKSQVLPLDSTIRRYERRHNYKAF